MGTEYNGMKVSEICMTLEDGQFIEIKTGLAEIAYIEGEQEDDNLPLNYCEFSVQVKLPKSMRCKSRKRFVKLLMASGIDRNMAQEVFAKIVELRNLTNTPACLKTSYQNYFIELWFKGRIQPGKAGQADG